MADKKDPWDFDPREPAAPVEEQERWKVLSARVIAAARQHGWLKTDAARRSGIPQGTFWSWLDGSYLGNFKNVNDRVETWLASLDEMSSAAARVPVAPGYFESPTSRKVTDALIYAQLMPSMVLGVLGSGMGKTFTADEYRRSRPGVTKVTMRPTTKSVQRMMLVLAEALEVSERAQGNLEASIGKKLKRNGRNTLLIVDEAQNLTDEAVNQLRFLLDEFGVGIALLGNEELYGRFGDRVPKPAYAQLHSRIGMRVRQLQPTPGDVDAQLVAWGIVDSEVAALVRAIARKPGALRQVTQTLTLAGMYAAGDKREAITAADVKLALTNRGVED